MATITGSIFNDNNTNNGTPWIYRPRLIGTEFADTIDGLSGDDYLDGGADDDTLNGGAGDDILYGGSAILVGQRDTLTGGLGNDIFDFNSLNDSQTSSLQRDVITDFAGNGNLAGDRIDLSDIDANYTIAGNQAFTFIGSAAFSGLGQIRYGGGILQANATGDLAADFEISLTGSPSIVASDIIL